MKKYLFGFLPIILAIVTGIGIDQLIIGELILANGSLSHKGVILVALFGGFLAFLVLEWAFFKFHEKDEFINQQRKFLDEWKKFNSLWMENKKVIEDIRVSKSRTEIILDKFAESNFLMMKMSNTIKEDLEFDKIVKESKDHLDYHMYISKLKINEFFSSHFIYSAEKKTVLQIPAFYFQNRIWEEFINISSCYYSLQLLDKEHSEVYLSNPRRSRSERNFLDSKLNGENTTALKKLFVLESDEFDNNGKLKTGNIKEYLTHWHNEFKGKYKEFPIKVIKRDAAEGILGVNITLEDTGIFGDTYGIQSVNKQVAKKTPLQASLDDNKFYVDNLIIDFYFDKEKTKEQKLRFNTLFDNQAKSKILSEVL